MPGETLTAEERERLRAEYWKPVQSDKDMRRVLDALAAAEARATEAENRIGMEATGERFGPFGNLSRLALEQMLLEARKRAAELEDGTAIRACRQARDRLRGERDDAVKRATEAELEVEQLRAENADLRDELAQRPGEGLVSHSQTTEQSYADRAELEKARQRRALTVLDGGKRRR